MLMKKHCLRFVRVFMFSIEECWRFFNEIRKNDIIMRYMYNGKKCEIN